MRAAITAPQRYLSRILVGIAALSGVCWTGRAHATEIRTIARTLGEGYMVRIPDTRGQLLSRRRLVQYVNLGVFDLLGPRSPEERRRAHEDGQLRIVTSMRVRHDFGSYQTNARGLAADLVRQIDERQIDLMFAY